MTKTEEQGFTLGECMDQIKHLKKKVEQNIELIEKYASSIENMPDLKTAEEQREEVARLMQSTNDLIAKIGDLYYQRDVANLQTIVKIGDTEETIHHWLLEKRVLGSLRMKALNALNTSKAQRDMGMRGLGNDKPTGIAKYYDELAVNKCKAELSDLLAQINSRLGTANAVTKISETKI